MSGRERRLAAGLARLVLAAALAALAALPACGGATRSRSTAGQRDAVVIIRCNIADAELWVDDRFVSEIRRLRRGIALSPGEHRIELRHDDYHTHYAEIAVAARERRTLTVELAQILP